MPESHIDEAETNYSNLCNRANKTSPTRSGPLLDEVISQRIVRDSHVINVHFVIQLRPPHTVSTHTQSRQKTKESKNQRNNNDPVADFTVTPAAQWVGCGDMPDTG